MSKVNSLKNSRDAWKQKAVDRANENRCLRKELARIRAERNEYKKATEILRSNNQEVC